MIALQTQLCVGTRMNGLRRVTPRKGLPGVVRKGRSYAQRDTESNEESSVTSKKKFITREEEPEEYWKSLGEREGKNPFTDPLAIIGLIAIFAPFIILGVAIALGYVDLSP